MVSLNRVPAFSAVTFLAMAAVLTTASVAAEPDSEGGGTTVQITPYVWASGYGGTIRPGVGAPTFRVKKTFGELLEDLDAAFFVNGLVRHNRLVVTADFSRTASSKEGLVPTGNPALPFVPAEGRLKQTSFTGLAGYRAVDRDSFTMDVLEKTSILDLIFIC